MGGGRHTPPSSPLSGSGGGGCCMRRSAASAAVGALEEEEEQGKVNLLPIALDASRPMRADCGSCHSDAAAAHSGDSGCTRDRRVTALCAIFQHATTGSLLPVASYSDRMLKAGSRAVHQRSDQISQTLLRVYPPSTPSPPPPPSFVPLTGLTSSFLHRLAQPIHVTAMRGQSRILTSKTAKQ